MKTVTKEFGFCAAHRVTFHEGKCWSVHGHNYELFVTVAKTEHALENSNWVLDFAELKRIVNEVIIDKIDHSIIVYNADEELRAAMDTSSTVLQAKEENRRWKIYNICFESTVENLAECFGSLLQTALSARGLLVTHIRLYETKTSYAEMWYD